MLSLPTRTLSSSSGAQDSSLSAQSTPTTLASSFSTLEQPSSTTLLSSTEAPTGSPTTPLELTTASSSDTPTTALPEPTPTPTPTITPLKVFDIVCNNEADFPGHADVSGNWQGNFAHVFGTLWMPEGGYMSNSSPPVDGKFKDNHGISYEYSVSWIPMCVTTMDVQNFEFPLGEQGGVNAGGVNAEALLKDDYKLCNNGGVGGSRQVGCLEYTFIGAK
ncbi:hypothetical protein F5Y12DRAFT_747204 [Xylaria sp. FL1777]|nr:hypothetical protein F5Y12DRAFT_747204 [Xylaria sp. FL1777]